MENRGDNLDNFKAIYRNLKELEYLAENSLMAKAKEALQMVGEII